MPEPFTAEERSRIAQVIDPLDPLLAHFTIQHDLRERYLHALEEVRDLLKAWVETLHDPTERDPDAELRHQVELSTELIESIGVIVFEAIDIDKIREWMDANRPLPWLDERLGDRPARLTAEMVRMIDGEVEGVPGLAEAAAADGVPIQGATGGLSADVEMYDELRDQKLMEHTADGVYLSDDELEAISEDDLTRRDHREGNG